MHTNYGFFQLISRFFFALVVVCACLSFFVVLFSDLLPLPFGGYADQRFLLVALSGVLVLCSALLGAVGPLSRAGAARASILPTLILCIAFIVLSAPFIGLPYLWVEPGMYVFFFLATFLCGFCLSYMDKGTAYTVLLVQVIAATCTIYGLASVNIYVFALVDGVTNLIDFIPWGFVNIRYWSHIATWCLPLIPLAALVGPFKKLRSWRIAVLFGAGMWWWILFLTAGRGSFLGVIFGVLLAGLLFGRRALPWLKVFFAYLATGILIWMLLSVVLPSFLWDQVQLKEIQSDSSGRIPLFSEAWQMSLQHFPFGMGPQSWLTHGSITEEYAASKQLGHPHNMYLMWAAEYGWLLILGMAFVVIQAIRYFWQCRSELVKCEDSKRLLLLAGFTASVSAALFHAGISAVFMAPGSMLIGMFVLVAFWALIQPTSVFSHGWQSGFTSIKKNLIVLLVAVAITSFWGFWGIGVWKYYIDMRSDETYYYQHEGGAIYPRFWFHGNFPREVHPN